MNNTEDDSLLLRLHLHRTRTSPGMRCRRWRARHGGAIEPVPVLFAACSVRHGVLGPAGHAQGRLDAANPRRAPRPRRAADAPALHPFDPRWRCAVLHLVDPPSARLSTHRMDRGRRAARSEGGGDAAWPTQPAPAPSVGAPSPRGEGALAANRRRDRQRTFRRAVDGGRRRDLLGLRRLPVPRGATSPAADQLPPSTVPSSRPACGRRRCASRRSRASDRADSSRHGRHGHQQDRWRHGAGG